MIFSSDRKKHESKSSPMKALVNIAAIVSAVVTCMRLAFYGIISIQTAGLIMIGVVVFVAIGNNVSKIMLAMVALLLFTLLYSSGNKHNFSVLMGSMLSLILVLVGVYVILKAAFGIKKDG